jgi:hypothetical protein
MLARDEEQSSGAKATILLVPDGTTEVVPFPKAIIDIVSAH